MFVTTANDTMLEVNPLYLHRLTVHDVRQMLEAGVLRDGDPIELIEGVLIRKDRSDTGGTAITQGERHAEIVERLQDLIPQIKALGFRCRSQLPIQLSDASAPDPDLAVYRERAKPLALTHPHAEDIIAVLEVSDSSLQYDRTTKQRIYALAAIPNYWIVNIPDRQVEVYRSPDPASGKYMQRTDFSSGETVPLDLGGGKLLDVAVTEILA